MGNGSVCEQDGRYHEIYPELGVGDNAGGDLKGRLTVILPTPPLPPGNI